MKKVLGTLLPATLLCFGAIAHAQTSVTLYGLIDEGLNYTNNAGKGSAYQMRSGDSGGSRFGLRGVEDLGAGTAAIFDVESGYDLNSGESGQGGLLFGRQAWVGLRSKQYGQITFGRQYDPTVDLFSAITPSGNWAGDVAATPFDNDNSDWDFRVNNSVKYVSPNLSGFTAEAMYGFSNAAAGFANNRLYSAAGQYQYGGLTAVVAYLRADNAGAGTIGAITSASAIDAAEQQNIDTGVAYKYGHYYGALTYSHTQYDQPTGTSWLASGFQPPGGRWTSWKFDNIGANGQYWITPDLYLGAAYDYTIGQLDSTVGNFSPRWHQVSLEVNYSLSARTSVYVQGQYQHVENAHTGTAFDDAQSIAAPGPSSTPNQVVVRVAMLHRF
jgi:predicted porin